jgi:hypothetical protein
MSDIVDLDEAMTKTGAELFKELYRIYPVAEAEDYFKQGQWKVEQMKTDLMLLESHRRESGAPDVPDLEDIKVPSLPMQTSLPTMFSAGAAMGLLKPAGAVPGAVAPRPVAPVITAANPGGSTSVVEIRLIALFVAKWKLEPATSKVVLAKLTPLRRRYVIQNFKATTTGAAASKELEDFIAQCEEDKSWDTASTPATVAPPAGVKRPLTPATVVPAKKPAM